PTAHSPENRHHLRLMRPGKERYPAARGSRINPLWLWFGVLGGPVAFGVARLVGIALTSGHCVRPAAASALFGLTPAEQLMAAVTIAAALVAGAAGIASWHVWRRT